MTEPEPILTISPISPGTAKLREKYYEQFAAQSERLDALATQLITLELAIPGIYAAVLKLVHGADATIPLAGWIIAAFLCWFIALALTLVTLIPREWKVDPTIVKNDPTKPAPVLGLEDFFIQSARYKRRWLIPAIALFWAGIFCAAIAIF
ncbi:MAG: hypothetical protein R3E31_14030 [Chloroflexota bacterium]